MESGVLKDKGSICSCEDGYMVWNYSTARCVASINQGNIYDLKLPNSKTAQTTIPTSKPSGLFSSRKERRIQTPAHPIDTPPQSISIFIPNPTHIPPSPPSSLPSSANLLPCPA